MKKLLSTLRIVGDGHTLLWIGMWLVLMIAALYLRPLLPVDETRYLAVAWEMWLKGNFLVPHLNGETYSHKPPLLFWLMHLGWAIFGVNEWWPRLVAPIFGLFNLYLTGLLAQYLWPNRESVATAAPIILIGCFFWTLFTTLTMFDMLLTFCSLLAMIGVIRAWQNDQPNSFVLLALAVGIGLLTKGPAIFLATLPAALFVPFWTSKSKVNEPQIENKKHNVKFLAKKSGWSLGWKGWYFSVGLATLGGIIIALLWAIPAAISGGEEYRNAIFWGQSAGRMVNSFAHARPWWWFLAVLPILVLPWTIWPATWRAIANLKDLYTDNGIRFCLIWFLPALIIFSSISGKQPHYLLPVFPALALIGARLLIDQHEKQIDQISSNIYKVYIPAGLFIIMGILLSLVPSFVNILELPPLVKTIDSFWGLILSLLTVALIFQIHNVKTLMPRITSLAMLSVALVITLHLILKPLLDERYNLDIFSKQLRKWQDSGISLAYLGKYHGLFTFMGRLESQITPVGLIHPDLENWQKANPRGYLIVPVGRKHEQVTPIYTQLFRGRQFIVITVDQSLAYPEIIAKP